MTLAGRILAVLAAIALLYVLLAYVVLPALWTHHEHQPGLAKRPMVTRTAQGIPGDPLNVGLVGHKEEVIRAMRAAELVSGRRHYPKVKHRNRRQRAFRPALPGCSGEQPLLRWAPRGPRLRETCRRDADRRHHVRFWQVFEKGKEGRPIWLGSVTFDRGVGVSHYTGAITHHIAPDIDAEREGLIAGLNAARMLITTYQASGAGPTLNGRNGGGDRYFTDGEITVGVISSDAQRQTEPAEILPSPSVVTLKNAAWSSVKGLLNGGE